MCYYKKQSKSHKTGKIRKKNINHEGYYFVNVSLGSRENKPSIKIHRAVAETFLINENNASFVDMYNLIELIKKEVYDKTNISLELEIKIITPNDFIPYQL